MKPWQKRAAALSLGLVAATLTLEILLRILGGTIAPRDVQGDRFTKKLKAGADRVVLCYGDSMTFGIGASHNKDYPSQLEKLLGDSVKGQTVKVINGGISGSNSSALLVALPGYLQAVQPDVVLLMTGNTNETNYFGYNSFLQDRSLFAATDDWLFNVRVYRLIRYIYYGLVRPARMPGGVILDGIEANVVAYENWLAGSPEGKREQTKLFRQGLKLLRFNQFEEAVKAFKQGKSKDPGQSGNHWGLAAAYQGLRRDADALKWFKKCLEVNPENPNCYFGVAELQLNDPAAGPELITLLNRAIRVAPNFSGTYWALGMVHRKAGRKAEAMKMFKRCVEADARDSRCYPNLIAMAEGLRPTPEGQRIKQEFLQFLKQWVPKSALARDCYQMMIARGRKKKILSWVRSDIKKIVGVLQRRGIPVVLVKYPDPSPVNWVMGAVARELKLPVVHNDQVFRRLQEEGAAREELFLPDRHCTDKGNGVIAKNVAAVLVRQGLTAKK